MLALLDQVEDVISVEDFVSTESEPYSSDAQDGQPNEMPVIADSVVKGAGMGPPHEVSETSSNGYFLVLEVCLFFPSFFFLSNLL